VLAANRMQAYTIYGAGHTMRGVRTPGLGGHSAPITCLTGDMLDRCSGDQPIGIVGAGIRDLRVSFDRDE
jgi:hypothetical protein